MPGCSDINSITKWLISIFTCHAHTTTNSPSRGAQTKSRKLFELIMPAVFPEERTLGGRFSWPWRGSRAAHAINEKSFLRST